MTGQNFDAEFIERNRERGERLLEQLAAEAPTPIDALTTLAWAIALIAKRSPGGDIAGFTADLSNHILETETR